MQTEMNESISCRVKMETSQEDMKLLGVFGIWTESNKILAPCRKIFIQIGLAFILPLCYIFLAQTRTFKIQFSRIQHREWGGNTYPSTSSDGVVRIRLNFADLFPFIFSLLSTSALVYTIACIYANRHVSFKKVISIMPHVCIRKRLIVTFIVTDALIYLYMAVASGTIALCLRIDGIASLFLSFILLIGCMIGFVYITTVFQLAGVVTILEDSNGIKAMKRSRNLTKGKFRVALSLSFMLNVLVWTIHFVFYNFVLHGISLGMWKRALVGFVCLALLVTIYLYGLVLQTITYFVCKSYHNETIDKPTLSQHLGEYEGRRLYDPNAVQLKQIYSIALSMAIKSFNIVLDQLLTMF